MKIDASVAANLNRIGAQAAHLEAIGFDGLRLAELNHDPFMPLAIAAEHTRTIELSSGGSSFELLSGEVQDKFRLIGIRVKLPPEVRLCELE